MSRKNRRGNVELKAGDVVVIQVSFGQGFPSPLRPLTNEESRGGKRQEERKTTIYQTSDGLCTANNSVCKHVTEPQIHLVMI